MAGTVRPANLPEVTSPSGAECRNYFFPVKATPESNDVYDVFGQLCTKKPTLLGRQPVQVLMHGGTYSHDYFDWPYKPKRYSYVRHATEDGFTTLNIDRLGYGLSDHPVAVRLDFDVAGYVTHQIVQYLRQGALGREFGTVVLNGYSMGGLAAEVEAAKYRDVDAVTVHAVAHQLLAPRTTIRLAKAFYPATLDPKFQDEPWTLGYLTSIPNQRSLFHGPPSTYDPANLVYEEALKDTLAVTELTDITTKSYSSLTKQIRVPFLFAPGRYDKIWCSTTDDCRTDPVVKNERTYYKPSIYSQYVVPRTGHGVILGRGAHLYFDKVTGWLADQGIRGQL